MSDNVLHPAHYAGEIETIDFIRDKLTADGFRAYCIGNVLKYISRYEKKGAPLEDLQKAQVYLNWAVETFGSNTKAEPEPEPQAEPPAEVKKPERKKPRTIINLDAYEITALIWAMNEYIHNGQFAERI